MAVSMNGNGKVEPGQKGLNGHAIPPRSKTVKARKGFTLWSSISRLLTWYGIVTILLRCPSTVDLVTDASPMICKPYFQVRSVVAPYVEPYYDAYAAPYVDAARPYYATLDKRVIAPVTALGIKYGAPRVAQAQAFGQLQWEKSIQPEVLRYQEIVKKRYNQTLAPHVGTISTKVGPYYGIAKASALDTYYGHILPTYNIVQPYALQAYGLANNFAVHTGLPYTKWALTTGSVFLDRTVWPKLRILYGENVEPQLVRIGERLGRYREGKKVKSAVDEIDSSSSASSATETFLSISSSAASAHATTTNSESSIDSSTIASSEAPANTPRSPEEVRQNAQNVVATDLKVWQEKVAKAVDEGADELQVRITEITDRLIQNQAQGVGKALLIQLEETVKFNLKKLKSTIISIVENSSERDSQESEEAIGVAVRKAGVAIKDKAQAIRKWRQNYDTEINSLCSKAVQDTFAIIEHIKDLGLQEVGMRWAWTDGITHKDWTKYHALRSKFDEWSQDVEQVAAEHGGITNARVASEEIENTAMDIAEQAAKELAGIKETGRWKLSAGDSSDDWTPKIMPVAAAAASQKIKEKINEASEAIAGTFQTVESIVPSASSIAASLASDAHSTVTAAGESISSVATSISAGVVGTPQSGVESAILVGTEAVSSLADRMSNSVIGTQQGSAESVASMAKASISGAVDQASSFVIGTQQGTLESVASVARESASSISAKASSSLVGEVPGILEQAADGVKFVTATISEVASGLSDAASSSLSSASDALSENASEASKSIASASSSISSSIPKSASDTSRSSSSAAASMFSTASKKVWGGAMAEPVERRNIIYDDIVDDDDTFSEKIQSMASQAGDKFSDVTRAVSEALLKPTSTQGSMESVTSLAAKQYSSALAAASSALYGAEQGTGESIASVASSRYSEAVAAASAAIYGIPLSPQQSLYSAASSAYYGAPQGALESISSVAASRLSEGLSLASAHFESAKSLVGATPTPAAQKLLDQAQHQYYAGIGLAHARYSEFLAAASSAIMPIQTPFHESLYSKASEGIVGTPMPAYETALSKASAQYASAVAAASSNLEQVLESVTKSTKEKAAVPASSLIAMASSQYSAAIAQASNAYGSASDALSGHVDAAVSHASTALYGSETPLTESIASAASENWEALITKASSQIYGAPTPYYILSEVKSYAASATDSAASQYSAVQSLIGELVSGREPDFTESVYSRFSSAYYTGAGEIASSASSYASEAYASASSVVESIFTPPPTLEAILDSASSRVNEAVEAASIQIYGTSKRPYEEATSSIASAYTSMQSVASEKIYGSQTGYAEGASSSIAAVASSAEKAISEAIYGTETGYVESATNGAGDIYSAATSVITENYSAATDAVSNGYSAAQSRISSAIYGPEQGAIESAQKRLGAAVESARVKLAEYAEKAGEGVSEAASRASEGVEDFASSVGSVVEEATGRVKDEL
ncbi:hypothetical protein B7494_g4088 [Chlorociboria aeruginascens]|nr:hypothetical protein B7494_g4088 [Chlorociboria aeruginascens]